MGGPLDKLAREQEIKTLIDEIESHKVRIDWPRFLRLKSLDVRIADHFFFGDQAYVTLPVLGEFPQRTLPLPIATA